MRFLALAASLGFLGVLLGAFGAHGLKGRLADLPDFTQRMEWWHTAVSYQMWHALLLVGIALVPAQSRLLTAAGWLVVAGIATFSGSLYSMTVTGIRVLGAVTPLGGLCFLAAWAAVLVHALRR